MNNSYLTTTKNLLVKNVITLLFVLFTSVGFAQSTNDNCASSTSLTLGTTCSTTAFTFTANTTETGTANPTLCNSVTASRDGWYRFTTGAATTQITLDATTNRPWTVAIYSGNCSGFTQIACNNAVANTSITLNPTVSPNTIYYIRIGRTNVNTNAWTGTVCVYDTTTAASSYCTPAMTTTSASGDYISNVTFAGINNTTGDTASDYTYYPTPAANVTPGSSYPISLLAGGASSLYSQQFGVWIDYNQNGVFTDAGEFVFATTTANFSPTASTGTIIIPAISASVLSGTTRMRVGSRFSTAVAASNSCLGGSSYGEYEDYNVTIMTPAACTGTPTAGTTTTSPTSGSPGSSYTVSTTGYSTSTGLTFQWQYSTNGGSTWTNQGAATGTYSNYIATAPAVGVTTLWHLIVTCTSSGQSATSTNGTFTSVSTLNVPTTGSNNVTCGTNIVLYDNGGPSGDYANSSDGYTVLNAGVGATINISGNYVTEGVDYIRIYNGTGTGGTLLATYSGSSGGTINYTGTTGQTLTIRFNSDSSIVYSGFTLSVTYSGACVLSPCAGTPTGGTVTTNPNTAWPTTPYIVSATGYTQALNMTYQWQYSTTGAGGPWINAGVATSSYANYNATAPASGDVHWQLLVTCTNSSQSSTSTIGVFVTMEVSDVVTGCPNVVSGGLGLSGADPATITCVSASGCVDLEATYLDLGDTTNYIVEPIAYNPPFAFTGLANQIVLGTDDYWSDDIVDLPFDFCFYGNTYDKVLPGPNGALTFDTSLVGDYAGYSFSNNLPSTVGALFNNTIYGVYHDINSTYGGQFGWELVNLPSGCRALVVAYSNVPMFDENTILYSGMIVLYENSNIIEVYIKEKNIDNFGAGTWNDGNAIVGLQNSDGTLATVPPGRNALDPNWAATNEAWRFVPNGTSIASIKWHEGSGVSGPVVGNTDVISVCPTSTTIYTAEITYTLCDGRTITEVDETTVTVNKDKIWDGSTSTDWNVASNWTPSGVPTAAQSVNIPNVTNDPIVGAGADALACSLSIENGGVLTINAGENIIVTNTVTVAAGGTFNVQNSASLIQVNNVSNSGIMNMQRTASMRKLDYVYWSSPVTLGSSFSSGAISPLSPTNLIFKWTPTIGGNVNGFGNWTQAVENMAIGKGYIVRGPNTFTATAAPYTATFIGTPNNGNISAPIQRGTYDGVNYNTLVSTSQGTKFDDNWNLIGNPYPSAIRAISFLTANTNLDGYVKIWTHGTLPGTAIIDPFYNDYVYNYTVADYITYNSSGTSSGPGTYNGFIPAGQGFFVSMLHGTAATNETVQFNNTMRSSTYNNSVFHRTAEENSETNEEGRIWLDLVDANGQNVRTLVAYVEGATNDRDRLFDAFTDNKSDLNLYSNIENEHMIIQGRTLPFEQNDKVPMGIKVSQDGNYSITIAAVEGLFSNASQTIYIEDTQTNIIHDLRQSPYVFSAITGNDSKRFVLRYTNETLGNDDFEVNPSDVIVISNDVLTIQSTKNGIKSITIHDVIGRLISKKDNVNANEFSFTTLQKNNTTLLLKIELENGIIVNKKVIF